MRHHVHQKERASGSRVLLGRFKDRIICVYHDTESWTTRKEDICKNNSKLVANFAKQLRPGQWGFFSLGDEEKWYRIPCRKPKGKWNSTAEILRQTMFWCFFHFRELG